MVARMAADTRWLGSSLGERELERLQRRLERVCQRDVESESVERWQPDLLSKLSYVLPLSRGRFAFDTPYPAAEHFAGLTEFFGKQDILFGVECLHIPQNLQKEFRNV